ncbi:hypothetical protein [Constantimarinum furrinae]|uniref:Uncharacterized protein n=1 Tax=Constantimarinum furrinae TaxID=2562285 RepID=A0A7G8PW20_9FLAO|nr:hypothetical protein [Constantimarinum furrinae]QNJ98536.1 hypothetical protein ALE3EI_1989 [Constantimarinum furrinae]
MRKKYEDGSPKSGDRSMKYTYTNNLNPETSMKWAVSGRNQEPEAKNLKANILSFI